MTRTSQALKRLGVCGVAAATVLAGAPLLAGVAANAATPTPRLTADDCTSSSTSTTTDANTLQGSNCTTQAQVGTVKTLTFTYTENGAPVSGRDIDFAFTTNNQGSASFPRTQPGNTTSNTTGTTAQCTTDAAGKCSVNVTDNKPDLINVTATERRSAQPGAGTPTTANEQVQFRNGSTAVNRIDQRSAVVVTPDNVATASPGRPVELRYTAYDQNGLCDTSTTTGATSTAQCQGATVAGARITLTVNHAAYFTPNCTLTDANGSPQRGTAGNSNATAPTAATTNTAAQPGTSSTGTLNQPNYRGCSFQTAPANDAPVGALTSLGKSITVVTDQTGGFTVTVAEAADPDFNDDGIVDVDVTAVEAGSTRTLAPRQPGTTNSTNGSACATATGTAAQGCAQPATEFSTRVKALNGASVSIVPVDNSGLSTTSTNNVPNNQTRLFVVQLRDQYGNLTLSNGTAAPTGCFTSNTAFCSSQAPASNDANDAATLTKTGVGSVVECGRPYTSGSSCPGGVGSNGNGGNGAYSSSGTAATQNDNTTTQTFQVRGSYTDISQQERFQSNAQTFGGNGGVDVGTQTLTAKWVAPVTEFQFTPPADNSSTTPTYNTSSGQGTGNASPAGTFDITETDNVFTAVAKVNYYLQTTDTLTLAVTPSNTVAPGTLVTVTATAKDQFGNPVPNRAVSFFRSGTNNNCTNSNNTNNQGANQGATTGPQGTASFQFSCSDASTQNITASILDAQGNPEKSASTTVTFTGNLPSGSPSPSSTSTATTSPSSSPSSSPVGVRNNLTLETTTPEIPAGGRGEMRISNGTPNQRVGLFCYTRPATTFTLARPYTAVPSNGGPVEFSNLALGRNTRCEARYESNSMQNASNQVVIKVRTVISLSAVRHGVRNYEFRGRNLPRATGQLITLYRVDNSGNEIRTANLKTDDSGIYSVTRQFTGRGTFRFVVRTGQTNENIAGKSNVITVTIR